MARPVKDEVGRTSHESKTTLDSVSMTSLVFESLHERDLDSSRPQQRSDVHDGLNDHDLLKDEPLSDHDLETGPFLGGDGFGGRGATQTMDQGLGRIFWGVAGACVVVWLCGLFFYISSKAYRHPSQTPHDQQAASSRGKAGRLKLPSIDMVVTGAFEAKNHRLSWIAGPNGEDGMLLQKESEGKDFLVVEDVRVSGLATSDEQSAAVQSSTTLMKTKTFVVDGRRLVSQKFVPSKNLSHILIATEVRSTWRFSTTGVYWIFDVASQSAAPLIPNEPSARIQLASWSPTGDNIVFTRENNLFLRRIESDQVVQITTDGGAEVFNGVPDWVYEEEVVYGASATWWSEDGHFIAFMRTNETGVPDYPLTFFASRPTGKEPRPGADKYPDLQYLKYPKAGAHNPIVGLKFLDVTRGDVFSVPGSDGGFPDDDRLIMSASWMGKHLLVKQTNRVSDLLRVVLVDPFARTAATVRTQDSKSLDGGWFEISRKEHYIPADKSMGRAKDGYVDSIVHEGWNHLAYFTPLDNPEPLMLTSGQWEVDDAPSAVDLDNNLVYFVATKESSIQRHVYSVGLTDGEMVPITNTSFEGYYAVHFSSGAGYGLFTYQGPGLPWQKVINMPSNPAKYELLVEENKALADLLAHYCLPTKKYGTIQVDGVDLNYLERLPPLFDPRKTYPVLFFQYSGPGSQQVTKQFKVDFQDYVAATLGYICVTVDGRGTGFIGRANRVLTRGRLGKWESHDQMAAGKIWAAKPYVDAEKLAIWGWSFGGFMALKTLEQDAGRTFKYGMAVAPVTDWRLYDSIYTERYMLTPQENPQGYQNTAIDNVTALGQNVRFLVAHGTGDDNVHLQNTLLLMDKLDTNRVENYDVHFFTDSDHSITFHNAHSIVFDILKNWLVNAFNGEWLRVADATPNLRNKDKRAAMRRLLSWTDISRPLDFTSVT